MSARELAKAYDPKAAEEKWYRAWREAGWFHADESREGETFSMVIPPPNVTGSLHMGHALNNTIQDILARLHRMRGRVTLWMPGTDHAGIATQNVVERQLVAEGTDRRALGRDAFVERVWSWKHESGSTITRQLARLGVSLDWERERFTMDEGLSVAVREVFVRLFEEGLIYRDRYLINWCPRCHTALSDLEVEHEDADGSLWHLRYRAADGGEGVVVATTRPETLLGDTAVAVHPDDERYRDLVGRNVVLPVLGREIPVIPDDAVDREFGTGAVKVTPAHDPNDFAMGRRHGLEMISVMDEAARMNDAAGPYAGLDRFECRKRLVEALEADGTLVATEAHSMSVGKCYRCHTIVEPFLSPQWFVRVEPLAKPALAAVREGRTRFVPDHWTRVYEQWMEGIHDWCISRQLWWGHQIPAWYCRGCDAAAILGDPDGECVVTEAATPIVGRDDPTTCPRCGGSDLVRDPDVLDTWFSSALWPFSTMGWPEPTTTLERFYPTSVLVTGFDIIFFWVARMMMMGLHFMGDVPFRDVYVHALVRDEHGQKMSKSKGNVIDPLELLDVYGTDALRFTLVALSGMGRDIKLSEERVAGYRNFANKIWNAARFVQMSVGDEDVPAGTPSPDEPLTLADRWILHRLAVAAAEVEGALVEYRFNDAAMALYRFLWNEYCDWYLELAKPALADEATAGNTRWVLVSVLEELLRLLHPIMPFVTEELWQSLRSKTEAPSIMVAPYPTPSPAWLADIEADRDMGRLIELIRSVRNVRADLNVPKAAKLELVATAPADWADRVVPHAHWVERLAGVGSLDVRGEGEPIPGAATVIVDGAEVSIPLRGVIDPEEEVARIRKKVAALESDIDRVEKKLANPKFVERAPDDVVEKERAKKAEAEASRRTLVDSMQRLEAL